MKVSFLVEESEIIITELWLDPVNSNSKQISLVLQVEVLNTSYILWWKYNYLAIGYIRRLQIVDLPNSVAAAAGITQRPLLIKRDLAL